MTARPGTRTAAGGGFRRLAPALAAGVLAALAGCGPKPAATDAAKEPAVVAVTAAPVGTQTVRRTIPVTGTLSGYEDVTLSPKVDGRILVAKYDVGDPAVPGAVLLEIDPADHQKAVVWERRSLDAELARLGLTDLPAGEFDVEAVPEVQRAEAARQNAKRVHDRIKSLPSASKTESDAADTELKVAEANKKSAVTAAQATLAAAKMRKASLDMAEQKLTDCRLRVPEPDGWAAWAGVVGPGFAPLRYTVAQKMASEGEVTRSFMGTNVYRLVIGHVLRLKATAPERYAPDVRVGQPVEVRVDAYPDAPFAGRVSRVNPTIDPASRTFQVEVEVPNAHGKLKPGGFAKAHIVTGSAAVAAVPPQALVVFAGVTKVFVADGDKAKEVLVEPGVREKDWLEVSGEVKPGARVITSGFSQLYDGCPIKLR
jgi:multidrug efflux pump subunit AcrA (membrane-fusion protein)